MEKRRYCARHVRSSVCLSVTSRTDEKMRSLSLTAVGTDLIFFCIDCEKLRFTTKQLAIEKLLETFSNEVIVCFHSVDDLMCKLKTFVFKL
jgi:hypothetical protein